jgi:hypothetical protein
MNEDLITQEEGCQSKSRMISVIDALAVFAWQVENSHYYSVNIWEQKV